MLELKECSEKTIRREVYEFDDPRGEWEATRWTRVTRDGNLVKWVSHDGYGEMMPPSLATGKIKQTLEQLYQKSDYA